MDIELPESHRERSSKSWQTVVPLLLTVLLVCFITGSPRTTAARNATLPVDPALLATVYGAPVNGQKILSFKDDKSTVRIAAEQLVVTLKPGKSPTDARSLAKFLGGVVIGQVPRQRAYQLRVTARGKEELDALLTRARTHPAVHKAGYNSLVEFLAVECPARSDNSNLIRGRHRCAFEDIEYYTALTFFDAAREYLTLFPVNIAVLDTGLDQNNLEFRGFNLINLNRPGTWITDTDSTFHGTQVASLIAAADDNHSINGIASRFLGPQQLTLLSGTIYTAFDVNVLIERAAMAGADIVNMSFVFRGDRDFWNVTIREVIEEYPEMLFVVGIPVYRNSQGILYERSAPPAGIALDNVVTVGGMHACNLAPLSSPDSRTPLAADIRAPAEEIPVLTYDYGIEYVFGTSFAIPMVTSLAAILKSLKPELSPREIKTYLQTESMLFGPNLTFRLAMLRSIVWLLMNMDVDPTVRDWIDPRRGLPLGPPSPPLPGRIMGNVCGEAVVSVVGIGDLRPSPFGVYGIISPDHTLIELRNIDPEMHKGAFHTEFPLEPGTYNLVEDNEELRRGVELRLTHIGDAVSGNLIITEDCWITERFPDTNEPLVVNMSGRFNGVLEGRHRIRQEFEGYFADIPFTMRHQMRGHPLLRYFENNCAGGTGQ